MPLLEVWRTLKALGMNCFTNEGDKCIWLSWFTNRERQQICGKRVADQLCLTHHDELTKENNELHDKINQLLASLNTVKRNERSKKTDQFWVYINNLTVSICDLAENFILQQPQNSSCRNSNRSPHYIKLAELQWKFTPQPQMGSVVKVKALIGEDWDYS